MKRAAGVLLIVVGMAAVAVAHADARTRVSCGAGRTVEANAKVRVFWVRRGLYACASHGRKPLRLYVESVPCPADSSSGCDSVDLVRLTGRYAAVAWEVQQRDETSSGAAVFDVMARKRVHTRYTSQQTGWSYGFTDMEITSHGGLGVIEVAQEDGLYPSSPTYTVRKADSNGAALLESGSDIAPRSLAYSDGTLYWTRAGVAHSSTVH
jgi:hypothetical protein